MKENHTSCGATIAFINFWSVIAPRDSDVKSGLKMLQLSLRSFYDITRMKKRPACIHLS